LAQSLATQTLTEVLAFQVSSGRGAVHVPLFGTIA
jgi:hypothetical protein